MKVNNHVSSRSISLGRWSLIAMAACAITASTQAAVNDYFWTAPGSGDGGTAAGGTGTWDTGSALWRNNTVNGALTTYPSSGTTNNAYFGATVGTVTLATGANLLANQLIFNTPGYTIAGSGSSTITLNGTTPTINAGTGTTSISATLAGSAGLTVVGSGSLALSGLNTFTGGINMSRGANLVLDYTTNASGVVVAGQTVGLGNGSGGTLTVRGNAGSTSLALGNLIFSTGQNTVVVDKNGGGGTSLALGNMTRSTAGSLLFDLSGGGTATADLTSNATTGRVNLIDGVLVAGTGSTSSLGVVVRTGTNAYDFATGSAAGTGATISAFGATTDLATTGGATSTNYKVSGSKTITNNTTSSTIRVDTTAASGGTLTINSGFTLTLGKNSILFDGTGNYNVAGPGTLGGTAAIFVQQWSTGTVTFGSDVGFGGQRIDKYGTGLLVNNSTNPNTNGINVYGGVYRTGPNTTASGAISLGTGGTLELTAASGDFTRSLGTTGAVIQFLSDGGFSAFGGNRVVAIGGTAAPTALVWGSTASFLASGNRLTLSAATCDSTVEFRNALDFNGLQREVNVPNGTAATDARLTGVLSSAVAGGGLYKSGDGTLELAGAAANTYTGATTVGTVLTGAAAGATANGGTLVAGSAGALGSGTTGTSSITVNNGGTLLINNAATTDHVRDTAAVRLGSTGGTGVGGTVKITTGVNEGSAATVTGGNPEVGASAKGLGALTLLSNSTLDLDTAGAATLLVFDSFAPGGFTLNVTNYANANFNGTDSSGLAADDRLVFNSDLQAAGLLGNISLNGVSGLAREVSLGGGFYEIGFVPVPEPATWIGALALVCTAAVYGRRRLRSVRA